MKKYNTIGIDLGDTTNTFCVLDHAGDEVERGVVDNTAEAISGLVARYKEPVVAIEACTHSPWIANLLKDAPCTLYVGNPRKLRMIWDATDKTDDRDAMLLARIARFDPRLLYPIRHRGQMAHRQLQIIRSRDALVAGRTKLVNHVRGVVKVFGEKLPKGISTAAFASKVRDTLPEMVKSALLPILDSIETMTKSIRQYDRQIETMGDKAYPEAKRLREINGVGPITSLAFILTLEDPTRVRHCRDVGPMLGLVPRRDQSGEIDRQLRITKQGDTHLRRLLVGSAQYILGPFGTDCDLHRHGMKIAARGGKNGKKRALVAVARKLAVLMMRLWKTDEPYDPDYNQNRRRGSSAGAHQQSRGAVPASSTPLSPPGAFGRGARGESGSDEAGTPAPILSQKKVSLTA